MSHTVSRRNFLKGIGALGMLTVLSSCARTPQQAAAVGGGLPAISVWATYPTGTGTYNDLAALANMVSANGGTRVRLMTDNTGIGRLGPVINGTAQYGRVGDEYYYAFEGNDEYTSENWGPTPIRLVWTPPGNYGILTRKDSGIETVADIRGKRYPRLISSTSMNRKLEVALALGGLTTDDVEMVDIAYSEQAEAMKTGHLDVMYQNVVGGTIEELNSQYPIRWLDLGGGTPEQVLQRTQRFVRTLSQITQQYQRTADALEYADLRYPDGYALRLRGVTTVSRERALEMAKRQAVQGKQDNKKTRPTEGRH